MKQYLLLLGGGQVSDNADERAAAMRELTEWYGQLSSTLIDGGAALDGRAKTVAGDGRVSDGTPMTMPSGYMVIKASSLDEAVSLAKGYPLLKRGFQVSVLETFKEVA